jgi:hypothetical protein
MILQSFLGGKMKYVLSRTYILILFNLAHQYCVSQTLSLDVDKTYDFSPHTLSKKEQEKKGVALDAFWNKVKDDTAQNLPLLRSELKSKGHMPYFYYDGAGLLLYLSHARSDKELAAVAIEKCDINDIDAKIYIETLNSLAFDNINVTNAAIKILKFPNYNFFVVEHVMYFNQDNCLAYSLLPMRSEYYVDTLINSFKLSDTAGKYSILYTLWLGYNCKGDSLIRAVAKDISLGKNIRSFADTLMRNDFPADQEVLSLSSNELIAKRINALKRFSDEGLADLIRYSAALRKRSQCEVSPKAIAKSNYTGP